MLTFQKRRTFQNSYGTATIDVVYDDERDDLLHIIRDVTTPDGKVYDNVNLVVRAKDIPDDVVDEAIGMRVNDVVAQKKGRRPFELPLRDTAGAERRWSWLLETDAGRHVRGIGRAPAVNIAGAAIAGVVLIDELDRGPCNARSFAEGARP